MQKKKGISLIVLVITIIVMVILAASVVITLNNTNIINQASDAVNKTDIKQVEQIASIAWADAYAAGEREVAKLQEAVDKVITDNKIDKDKYVIEVTNKGVAVSIKIDVPEEWKASVREITSDGVPIPIGFVKSPYPNEGKKNNGLVIYALTEEEIEDGVTNIATVDPNHQHSLENRNQFVWIPVDRDKFETQFRRQDFLNEESQISYELGGEGYWELLLDENNMPSATQNTSYVSSKTLQEATAMYESVKKYGGFYMARYEMGGSETEYFTLNGTWHGYIAKRVKISDGTYKDLSVTMGKYPYNEPAWGSSMSNEVRDDGAVSLSRALYPKEETTYGVVSTLTYGVQWDRTLDWWTELNPNLNILDTEERGVFKEVVIDQDEANPNTKYAVYVYYWGPWGNFISKPLLTDRWYLLSTGGYKKANIFNIYDMAGNVSELTMEGNSTDKRVQRGGTAGMTGTNCTVAYRSGIDPTSVEGRLLGFRPALYIK
ncbi:MAG: hypothetical protein IKL68_03215 [Clostridia bacterium]|nr:hypothetical protein [Clostridia bacterium]